MMIPYGYKQTEVGVIPEDWKCVKIKDVATISMCKRIFANQTSTIGDVPFYKIGTFGKEADAYISSKLYVEYRNKYSFPQKGDILISAAGTLGRTVVYDGEKAYFQDSNIVWLDINKTRLCNEYLNQYYKVIKWASSEGSTIARLYNGIIYATYISLPPLPEQQRIANALSDVDGMISSLEKLIAKYKSIKTACLQQMFPQNGETVPRMRLPGFTDAWEQRKFEEIAVRSSVICSDDTLPRVEYEDIVSGTGRLNKDIYAKQSSKSGIAFHQGDVLYGKLRPYLQNWLLPTFDGLAVGDFWVLQPQNADSSFLYRLIQSRQFDEVANQSTGTKMPRADWKLVSKTVFSIPSNISEQAAIGTYFTALDNLITLHQRKLDKAKKIKQGMMQQLLTGKIRLSN